VDEGGALFSIEVAAAMRTHHESFMTVGNGGGSSGTDRRSRRMAKCSGRSMEPW
jgi:hypothetical protein